MANKYAPIIEQFQTRYTDKSWPGHWQDWPKLPIGPPLDEAHLDQIELQLGHLLPEDYREFLRDYAGIWLEPDAIFPLNQGDYSSEGSICGFHDTRQGRSIADGYYQALRNCIEMSGDAGEDVYPGIHLLRDVPGPVEEIGWPEELLPIGYDQGGGDICLALFGLRPGAIFRFGGDITLIADSFDEFMHLLSPGQ